MDWQPISEGSVWDLINAAELRMTAPQQKLWDSVRIIPMKWTEPSYGVAGGGFWAVGVIGSTVVWYNDIEDGFNCSPYRTFGEIEEYRCNQDDLEHVMEDLLAQIKNGYSSAPVVSPPIPVEFSNSIR
jgi:hypothetical protein